MCFEYRLGSMLVSTANQKRVSMGKVVGFHVGFELSGYGGGHHEKGTAGVHVEFHVGFHVGFHLSEVVSSFQRMGEVTMRKVPWGCTLSGMLASMLGSSCQCMGEATMRKIPDGVHLSFHVGFQLSGYGLGAPGGPSLVGPKSSSRCVSRWVNAESNIELVKCPRRFGARKPHPELLLLGRSP